MSQTLPAGAALRRPVAATLVDLAIPVAMLLAVLVVLALLVMRRWPRQPSSPLPAT